MITVIFAGGSGTRLWPMSTPDYPKHLLALTGDKTLAQYAYERSKSISKDVYLVTDSSHSERLKEQIPSLPNDSYIIEPGRRGTAGCLIAALVAISRTHDPDEPIAFLPADHHIRDKASFSHTFNVAGQVAGQNKKIVLIGTEPYYPATGFGYIEKGAVFDEASYTFNVQAFKEKPSYTLAQKYLKSGNYLWNCGYFVASLNTFVETIKKLNRPLYDIYTKLRSSSSSEEFDKLYLGLDNDSIDYALMEKADNLLVIPALFDWMDLGSYTDLHKASARDENGNYVKGSEIEIKDVENSFIYNSEKKPLAVIGLDNIVVVNTAEGILVARKDLAQQIGEITKRLTEKNNP